MKHIHQKWALLILFGIIIIFFISCKKDPEKMTSIKVTEYKTGSPIANATINFYEGIYEIDPSCLCPSLTPTPKLFLSKQTDVNGICTVSETDYQKANYQIDVSKQDYVNLILEKSQTICEMDPAGQIKLHVIKSKDYPSGSSLTIYCNGERSTSKIIAGSYSTGIEDSTFIFAAFGNQQNTVRWKVFPEASNSPAIDSGFVSTDVAKGGLSELEIKY